MSFLHHAPLRQKLTWLAMTCSVLALFVAALALGTYEWATARRTLISHLTTLSEVTARNSAAALAFSNHDDGARTLTALEEEPSVVGAALYDKRGQWFAGFRRRASAIDLGPLSQVPPDGVRVAGNEVRLAVPVMESTRFGTLLVVADISRLWLRVAAYSIVLLATTLVSGLVAYLMTGWLKDRIVAPVQALAAAAGRVQGEGDYSVRVQKEADDELGALTDAFNAMLARIQHNEAEIARSAERLRLAVESARIGTWDWDISANVVIWNARNYAIYGVLPGTTITREVFYGRVHPDDRLKLRAALEAAQNGAADFSIEYRIVPGDSTDRLRYVVLRGRFLRPTNETVQRAVGVTLDITDRRLAELRAVEGELRFRTVAERAPAMIWSCDPNLSRDYFNKTWLLFTGRPLDLELGSGWQDGVPRADLDRWNETALSAAAQRDPYSVEYRLRRADGSLRWVVETGAPRLSADGSFGGYFGSCIDITTRKENEAELEAHVRARTRELELANQELESFSYSVSHDLRGPVRAIQGFAEIALEELAANHPDLARERIERVLKAADRMNKLTDAFISMARISRAELKLEKVNLSRLAEDVAGFLRSANPERAIDLRIAPDLLTRGDERLLRIALENLLSNAWKFTARVEQARIEIGREMRGTEPIFFVRDNGAGFDAALSHKLFQPFERLHAGTQFEGLGVGLNTVFRVIEKHGGRVWAESAVNQGATFFFTLQADPAPSRRR